MTGPCDLTRVGPGWTGPAVGLTLVLAIILLVIAAFISNRSAEES